MDLEELVDEAEQSILSKIPVDFDEIIEAAKKGVPAGLAEVVRSHKIDEYQIEPGTEEDIEFNKLIDILTNPQSGGRRRKTKRSTRVRKSRRSQRSLSSKQRRSYSGSSTSYLTKRRKQGSK